MKIIPRICQIMQTLAGLSDFTYCAQFTLLPHYARSTQHFVPGTNEMQKINSKVFLKKSYYYRETHEIVVTLTRFFPDKPGNWTAPCMNYTITLPKQ